MEEATTPLPSGTSVGNLIDGKFVSRDRLVDTTGADAMGLVAASPAANTLLGRLKALVDAVLGVGTRSYGAALTKVAYNGSSAQSGAIAATEVRVYNEGTVRCHIKVGSDPTATLNDLAVAPESDFTLRLTSGHKVAVISGGSGALSIVPVAG